MSIKIPNLQQQWNFLNKKKRTWCMYAFFAASNELTRLIKQHITDVTNRLGWVQPFRTNRYTVHNPFTTEQTERIVKTSQTILSCCVTRVDNETVSI